MLTYEYNNTNVITDGILLKEIDGELGSIQQQEKVQKDEIKQIDVIDVIDVDVTHIESIDTRKIDKIDKKSEANINIKKTFENLVNGHDKDCKNVLECMNNGDKRDIPVNLKAKANNTNTRSTHISTTKQLNSGINDENQAKIIKNKGNNNKKSKSQSTSNLKISSKKSRFRLKSNKSSTQQKEAGQKEGEQKPVKKKNKKKDQPKTENESEKYSNNFDGEKNDVNLEKEKVLQKSNNKGNTTSITSKTGGEIKEFCTRSERVKSADIDIDITRRTSEKETSNKNLNKNTIKPTCTESNNAKANFSNNNNLSLPNQEHQIRQLGNNVDKINSVNHDQPKLQHIKNISLEHLEDVRERNEKLQNCRNELSVRNNSKQHRKASIMFCIKQNKTTNKERLKGEAESKKNKDKDIAQGTKGTEAEARNRLDSGLGETPHRKVWFRRFKSNINLENVPGATIWEIYAFPECMLPYNYLTIIYLEAGTSLYKNNSTSNRRMNAKTNNLNNRRSLRNMKAQSMYVNNSHNYGHNYHSSGPNKILVPPQISKINQNQNSKITINNNKQAR